MNLTRHSPSIASQHAFLSPSSPAWLRYDVDKLDRVYHNHMAARRGTELHAVAKELIRLGIRLPDTTETLNAYVNDAIGFRLTPEQVLFYSENCFGTADACGFKNDTFRVFDLKTGVSEGKMDQLRIYAALFCLEYKYPPNQIKIELRIYQNDAVHVEEPDPHDIFVVMDRIITADERIKYLREEAM